MTQKNQCTTSNRPAAPMPPPTHIVTTPYFALRRLPSIRMWPASRAPVIPYGWPIEVEPLQKPRHRCDRANTHLVGLDAGGDETTKNAKRLEPLLRGERIAHDHTGGRTIGKLARVSGGDGLALKHRLDLGEALRRGVRARPLVLRKRDVAQKDLFGFLIDEGHLGRDRKELVAETAALKGGCGAALALEAVLVLALARNLVAFRDHFGGLEHRDIHRGLHRHELVVHRVKLVHVLVLHEADRFDPAGHRDFYAVEHHRTRGDRDRLQARRALPINRRAGDGDGQSGADRALARDVHRRGALLHGTSHDDVLNLTGLHLRASDRLPDHMPGHCRTFGIVQRAAKGLSDWRARGRNNYGLGHAVLQFASGHAAFAARSAGTGGYRRSTDADPNTSSACDAKHAPDGLPLQGQILCSDAREHQAFAARLTPGGGLLESGTKKSSDSGWLGSTR